MRFLLELKPSPWWSLMPPSWHIVDTKTGKRFDQGPYMSIEMAMRHRETYELLAEKGFLAE